MLDSLHPDPLPFRAAVESGDRDALLAALAEDVRLNTPMTSEPYVGRDVVGALLWRIAFEIVEDFRYVGELREGSDEVLRFTGHVGDAEIEGVDLIRNDADGRVSELTAIMRPFAGLRALEAAFGSRMPRTETGG
jgi:hypothetical protein